VNLKGEGINRQTIHINTYQGDCDTPASVGDQIAAGPIQIDSVQINTSSDRCAKRPIILFSIAPIIT
jgi:hypothetical protein